MLSPRAAAFASVSTYAGTLESPCALCGRGGAEPGEGKFCEITMVVEQGVIRAVRFKTNGCPSSVAAGSALCSLIDGRDLAKAQELTSAELLRFIGGLPEGTEDAADRAINALKSIKRAE